MFEILICCFLYLSVTTFILLRNISDLRSIGSDIPLTQYNPKISICIPARNEEKVIRRCITSVFKQNYSNIELLVLDDGSFDNTNPILNEMKASAQDYDFKILNGKECPDGWQGKNWACHQLGEHSTGDYILFLDADTWMREYFISSIVNIFRQSDVDTITVWPQQILGSFWERTIIPQLYYVIFTLLPVRYTQRDPAWLPQILRPFFRKYFSAACGQCLGFRKVVYTDIGGHAHVKNKVVEDIELARLIRSKNYKIAMYLGIGQLYCRMYEKHSDIFNGFRKNFLAGFGNNILLFLMAGFLHFVVFILPVVFLLYSIIFADHNLMIVSAGIIVFFTLQRIVIDNINKWDLKYTFFHVPAVVWFQSLAVIVIIDSIFKRKVKWKNRVIKT